MYAEDQKEKVREAIDAVELIGQRVELSRKGVNSYFGRCPFHDERTGSFHVRPLEKTYYCFGCQAKGDVFTFVMETEGIAFPEALEVLADKAGIELERAEEDPRAAARRGREKRLLEALERACNFYEKVLWESPQAESARAYLRDRGLTDDTLRTYRVGFAPDGDRLVAASLRAGFTREELAAAGLAVERRGALRDRFFARITFPLADERGRVRGFGARATREGQQPKYLNSSESEVFHKGRQLFAVDLARRPAAVAAQVVLAEGYTDVLALHQAGVPQAVGLMGTALTEDQVAVLGRTAPTLLLALDADKAGQAAMLKAADLVAKRRLELRVVPLPEGLDPADLLAAEGAEALRERVERSVPFVVFRVERELASADVGSAEGRDRALANLRPILAPLGPSVLREELVQRVTGHLDLPATVAATLVDGRAGRPRPGGPGPAARRSMAPLVAPAAASARDTAERNFLALCLRMPRYGREALGRVDVEQHFTSDLARQAARQIQAHPDDPLGAVGEEDPELGSFIAGLGHRYAVEEVSPESLEHAELLLERARLRRAMAAAKAEGSLEIARLAAEADENRRRIGDVEEKIGSSRPAR